MRNQEVLLYAQEIGLEVNAEKTKYFLKTYHQTAGKIHIIYVAKKPCGNVSS
jgi:hypothetical protein